MGKLITGIFDKNVEVVADFKEKDDDRELIDIIKERIIRNMLSCKYIFEKYADIIIGPEDEIVFKTPDSKQIMVVSYDTINSLYYVSFVKNVEGHYNEFQAEMLIKRPDRYSSINTPTLDLIHGRIMQARFEKDFDYINVELRKIDQDTGENTFLVEREGEAIKELVVMEDPYKYEIVEQSI